MPAANQTDASLPHLLRYFYRQVEWSLNFSSDQSPGEVTSESRAWSKFFVFRGNLPVALQEVVWEIVGKPLSAGIGLGAS